MSEYRDPQSYSRIVTDLRVTDLRDAAHAWERAAEGSSADAEHDAGRELAELALAVCDAYDSLPATVTVSDAAALGALVRAAWLHQLAAWPNEFSPEGYTWGTVRGIGDEHGNPADDSSDIRGCFLRVTTQAGGNFYQSIRGILPDVKAGVFVLDYNQHPEAHGPGVWCGGCPSPGPGMSWGALVAEARARKRVDSR